MKNVLLEPAYVWRCRCGKRNFSASVDVEFTDEAVRGFFDLEEGEEITSKMRDEIDGSITAPVFVSCECGIRYRAIDPYVFCNDE